MSKDSSETMEYSAGAQALVAGAYAKPCVSDVKLVADSVEDTAYGNEVRREAAQVNEAGKYEPKLTENGIPADVLAKLLPGDDWLSFQSPSFTRSDALARAGRFSMSTSSAPCTPMPKPAVPSGHRAMILV